MNINTIPDMSTAVRKVFGGPFPKDIQVGPSLAVMEEYTFKRLRECTGIDHPTGGNGKMWKTKSHLTGDWSFHWLSKSGSSKRSHMNTRLIHIEE